MRVKRNSLAGSTRNKRFPPREGAIIEGALDHHLRTQGRDGALELLRLDGRYVTENISETFRGRCVYL